MLPHPLLQGFFRAAFEEASLEPREGYVPIERGLPPLHLLLEQCISAECVPLDHIIPQTSVKGFACLLDEFYADVATPIDESYAKFLASVNEWELETCAAIIREKAAIEEAVKAQRADEAAAYAARVKQDYPALLQKEVGELDNTTRALADLDSAVNFLKQSPLNKEVLNAAEKTATQYRAKIVYLTETIKRRRAELELV
jgi:hypothetical protein